MSRKSGSGHTVAITLAGKSYVISTDDDVVLVRQAADFLNAAMEEYEQEAGATRSDHLALFSALRVVVRMLQEREAQQLFFAEQVEALDKVVAEALAGC